MLQTLHLNTERTWRGGEAQTLFLLRGLIRQGHTAVPAGVHRHIERNHQIAGLCVAGDAVQDFFDLMGIRALLLCENVDVHFELV